jgi:hypothetical protein
MLEIRRARRYPCQETVDCEMQGRIRTAYLKDVSMTGARLQGAGLPAVGTLIRLTPAFSEVGRQWIFAQVCWIRNGDGEEAGLRFLEPGMRIRSSWVADLLADTDMERRRCIRVPTELHLEVKFEGVRRPLEALSADISEGGAQVLLPNLVRPGTRAEISICLPWAVIDVPAQVVRPASLESAHHSLRFLDIGATEAHLLDCHLRDQVAMHKSAGPAGLSFLQLLNG